MTLEDNRWPEGWHRMKELFPLKLVPFGDIQLYAPNDPIDYLNRMYPKWQTEHINYKHHMKTGTFDNRLK